LFARVVQAEGKSKKASAGLVSTVHMKTKRCI